MYTNSSPRESLYFSYWLKVSFHARRWCATAENSIRNKYSKTRKKNAATLHCVPSIYLDCFSFVLSLPLRSFFHFPLPFIYSTPFPTIVLSYFPFPFVSLFLSFFASLSHLLSSYSCPPCLPLCLSRGLSLSLDRTVKLLFDLTSALHLIYTGSADRGFSRFLP